MKMRTMRTAGIRVADLLRQHALSAKITNTFHLRAVGICGHMDLGANSNSPSSRTRTRMRNTTGHHQAPSQLWPQFERGNLPSQRRQQHHMSILRAFNQQQLPQQHYYQVRWFYSHRSVHWSDDNDDDDDDDDESEEIILYRRNHDRLVLTRTVFSFACFHSACWVWYCSYFLPTFSMQTFATDPLVPAIGLSFAGLVQFLATVYPTRLVSKLTWRRKRQQLLLYRYTFPLIAERPKPVVFELGQLVLNPLSQDARTILVDLHADISRFVGHMTLQQKKSKIFFLFSMPYVLDIREPEDVPQPELLLESLMDPKQAKQRNPPTSAPRYSSSTRKGGGGTRGGGTGYGWSQPPPAHNDSKLRRIVRKRHNHKTHSKS